MLEKNNNSEPRTICLAPMLDYTDRHFRYLLRLITRKTFLYTEMVTTGAILFGKHQQRYLTFSEQEHPLALQLGGSDPKALAESCKIASAYNYDEINLNVGCPSPRVKSGAFGAVLMESPQLVSDCMEAMQEAIDKPITLKTRIGIDHNDDYDQLSILVSAMDKIGIKYIIVHARKAWLDGLSPKDNREIPPLRYDFVYQLKKDFPHLTIIINGGIKTHEAITTHLEHVDGVMLGREAYHNSFFMNEVDQLYFAEDKPEKPLSRKNILTTYLSYIENGLAESVPFAHMARHSLGLFHACPGARLYRRELSEQMYKKGAGTDVLLKAMEMVDCD